MLSNQFLDRARGVVEVSATKVSHSSVGGPAVVEKQPSGSRARTGRRMPFPLNPSLKGTGT